MIWDKANLSGKVTVNDITETARKYVPEMREKGADIVVVIAHSGLSADPYHSMAENSVYYLSEVPGVDAIMFGHAHAVFPGKDFADIKGADIAKGTLNGIPAVMHGVRATIWEWSIWCSITTAANGRLRRRKHKRGLSMTPPLKVAGGGRQ